MRLFGWILLLPLLALLMLFALENKEAVTISFWLLDLQITLPLSLLSIGLLFIGFLSGILMSWLRTLGLKREVRKLRRKTEDLADELTKRPLPEEGSRRTFCTRTKERFAESFATATKRLSLSQKK